jgi:solute carrier family 8 (sodium/calcium exchanger)
MVDRLIEIMLNLDKPGNLSISAGILFSGSMPTKVLRMYRFMKVACISSSTFMNHQKYYLYPAIAHVWHNYQKDYIRDVM